MNAIDDAAYIIANHAGAAAGPSLQSSQKQLTAIHHKCYTVDGCAGLVRSEHIPV